MMIQSMKKEIIASFQEILGPEHVLLDQESRVHYGHDETEDLVFPPDVVLRPENTGQVANIMRLCHQHEVPVVPIGGRTGLSGGALCTHGGVGLAMERFNRILDIDERNHQAVVEPGVITQVFQEAVIEKGLYYPVDPSSRGSCFVGGNLAECAGGPRAVKYGVTKDWVLNLEVVLPSGEIIWTGANVLKNSTGYDLTRLFVGSEGTLGVITKAVFKLIPYPSLNKLMLVPFRSAEKACEAVAEVFRAGVTPSALEFMERDAIDWTMKFVEDIHVAVPPEVQAHLLIEVDGSDEETIMKDCERILEVLERMECGEVLFAESEAQKDALWKLRRMVGEAVKANSIYKEEDTVVPRYELPNLLNKVKKLGAQYGFHSVCYGHAGDGNLHINIVKGHLSDEQWNRELPKAIRELFHAVVVMGGTLSGEHGIGHVQKDYMDIAFTEVQLELMRSIKKVFDPKGIMNPGKVFN